MIDVLHEHGVGLVRREHADRFGGHRPAGEPLHGGAEAVGAAEDEMVGARFLEQVRDCGAAPRHFGIGEMRVLRLVDGAELRGQGEAAGAAWRMI